MKRLLLLGMVVMLVGASTGVRAECEIPEYDVDQTACSLPVYGDNDYYVVDPFPNDDSDRCCSTPYPTQASDCPYVGECSSAPCCVVDSPSGFCDDTGEALLVKVGLDKCKYDKKCDFYALPGSPDQCWKYGDCTEGTIQYIDKGLNDCLGNDCHTTCEMDCDDPYTIHVRRAWCNGASCPLFVETGLVCRQ